MKLPQAHLWAILPALASFYSLSQALPLKESSVSVQSPDAAAPNQDRPVKFFELNLTEARGAPDGYVCCKSPLPQPRN